MNYTVRDARKDEVFRCAKIAIDVLNEAPTYAALEKDQKKVANFIFDGILKRPGLFMRVIADDGDQIVGGIIGHCEAPLFSNDKIARDITIMMDMEHRGKCLKQFIQILDEFKTWAIEQGAKLVVIGTSSGISMESMSRFLEKIGYQQIGSLHGHIVGE